jgi:LytS/YehU family sensor histidine kinase
VGYTTFRVELITLNSIYLLTSLFYTMLYLSIYYLQKHSKEKLVQETALRKKMEHQLLQLKKDVNPDLLYNSLETLVSLVQEDATKAEDFIDRLSMVYRYSLDHRHKELTSLESELHALQSLVYLYNEKFCGAISGHVTVSETEQSLLLIPGSLLDIMEEIILSTIITLQHPLSVDIFVENSFVVLHYTCNDKLLPRQAAGQTIARLTQTYGFFTDRTVLYNKTAVECIIKVPLLTAVPESPVNVQGILSRVDPAMHPHQTM